MTELSSWRPSAKNRVLRKVYDTNYARRIVKKTVGPAPYAIRTFGDPVLKTKCLPISDVDDGLRKLADDMITTMYLAPGVGLAGNQIGVQKRIFVYDDGNGEGARVMINPELIETSGEFVFEEGCLSVPEQYFPITRPDYVHMRGTDLDGNVVDIEASGYQSRILQHEFDHLEGKLLLSRLTPDQKKQAMKAIREQGMRSQ